MVRPSRLNFGDSSVFGMRMALVLASQHFPGINLLEL